MKTFLTQIAQLGAITDVTFLSTHGELLFTSVNNPEQPTAKEIESHWGDLITTLGKPKTADFIFAKGRYYLQQTAIGYLIVGMQNDSNLNKVREACIAVSKKLSNPSICKQILLKLLTETDDRLKPHVIKELVPLADRSVASSLIGLLKQRDQFTANSRDRLLLFICQALGYCKAPEAIEPLQSFLATNDGPLMQNVVNAAQIAIQQLKESQAQIPADQSIRQQTRLQVAPVPPASSSAAAPQKKKIVPAGGASDSTVPDLPEAPQIGELLQNGRKKEALALLLEHISVAARNRDFIKAEHLRNWLMKIDSLAVGEIIRAAEIIEEEGKAAINEEDLRTWRELIDNISVESFAALYHQFSKQQFGTGEMIVEQGDLQPTLFFINSGKVQVQTNCGGKSEPVSTLEQGTAFGAETFFELSVWTFGVKSLGAELFLLSRESFQKIIAQYPTVEAKLEKFSRQPLSSQLLFAQKGRKTRREHERKAANNRVAFILLDDEGNETGRIAKGDLIDIAQGGLAISFHASQKKTAAHLLGKQIKFSMYCNSTAPMVSRVGIVRAIGSHDPIGNRYSMHTEFTQRLTPAELRQLGVIDKGSS